VIKEADKDVDVDEIIENEARELANRSFEFFATMRPWMAASVLEQMEIHNRYPEDCVDELIRKIAKEHGKPFAGLETAEGQLAPLTTLSPEEEDALLYTMCRRMIDDKREGLDVGGEMLAVYLRGDVEDIEAYIARERVLDGKYMSVELHDKIMKGMLDTRNDQMVKSILAQLTAKPASVGFFAVGAAHMVGEVGLVTALRRAGYTVTRVKAAPKSVAARGPQ
jgi:uncharacterized protein